MSEKYRPDVRGWATLGMFALVAYVLTLIAFVPSLQDNELFKTVATLLLGTGGFGLVCAFLWGGSKASVAAVDTVNDMAKGATPARVVHSVQAVPRRIRPERISKTSAPRVQSIARDHRRPDF